MKWSLVSKTYILLHITSPPKHSSYTLQKVSYIWPSLKSISSRLNGICGKQRKWTAVTVAACWFCYINWFPCIYFISWRLRVTFGRMLKTMKPGDGATVLQRTPLEKDLAKKLNLIFRYVKILVPLQQLPTWILGNYLGDNLGTFWVKLTIRWYNSGYRNKAKSATRKSHFLWVIYTFRKGCCQKKIQYFFCIMLYNESHHESLYLIRPGVFDGWRKLWMEFTGCHITVVFQSYRTRTLKLPLFVCS